MGGGSIRISDAGVQRDALAAIGIAADEAESRFGFLLEALRYGAPPHGGIAYGVDRIVQRLVGADSIRDVIAFPKAASGADPLTGAPAPVDGAQLDELGLALRTKRPQARVSSAPGQALRRKGGVLVGDEDDAYAAIRRCHRSTPSTKSNRPRG